LKISKEAKEKLKAEIVAEILTQLESKKVRLDSGEIDRIVSSVQSKIVIPRPERIDQDKLVVGLLEQIKTDDERKRIDFYRQEVFTHDLQEKFKKEVLDQIPKPKDGEPGPRGEPGPQGEKGADLVLTEKDKKEIAKLIDVAALTKDWQKALAKVIEAIKTGKLKAPNAGIDIKGLISEYNKFIGDADWQNGLPGDGTLGANLNWIKLNTTPSDVPDEEGIISWTPGERTASINTGLGTVIQSGQELVVPVCNNSGVDIANGDPTYVTGSLFGCPTVAIANASSHETLAGAVGLATTDIPNGGFGFVADFGAVRGFDTSYLAQQKPIYVASWTGTQKKLTDVRPTFPDYAIQIGQVTVQDAVNGTMALKIGQNANDTFVNFWNGTFRESINFTVASDGTTITGSLAPANGHENMTMVFSDGLTTLDTTPPKTITLNPGTDAVPSTNFVYIPQSTKVLTVSTSDWPTTEEHIKVANVILKSAATTQTDGALGNRNWNDHVQSTIDNQGHLSHITEKIRQGDAQWKSGVLASASGFPSNVYIATTVGVVYQLHRQSFSAQSMPTNKIEVVNNFTAAYTTTTNLNTQVEDANGVSLANRSFSFVIWGVQNKTGQPSRLMCNLPTNSYAKNAPDTAVSDPSNFSVYAIPSDFQGIGFLIARFTFVLEADGITWSLFDTQDLRGTTPSTAGGGGTSGSGTKFPDSTFRIQNSVDDTKEIDFDASGITTATTRTIIMPDRDVDLNNVPSSSIKSGSTQANAGAGAGEIWKTSGHATLPDNVILIGV